MLDPQVLTRTPAVERDLTETQRLGPPLPAAPSFSSGSWRFLLEAAAPARSITYSHLFVLEASANNKPQDDLRWFNTLFHYTNII